MCAGTLKLLLRLTNVLVGLAVLCVASIYHFLRAWDEATAECVADQTDCFDFTHLFSNLVIAVYLLCARPSPPRIYSSLPRPAPLTSSVACTPAGRCR